jgi:hypothetical protein
MGFAQSGADHASLTRSVESGHTPPSARYQALHEVRIRLRGGKCLIPDVVAALVPWGVPFCWVIDPEKQTGWQYQPQANLNGWIAVAPSLPVTSAFPSTICSIRVHLRSSVANINTPSPPGLRESLETREIHPPGLSRIL